MKIVIIGPAYPFRGGIASLNERLAKELQKQGHEVIIYTFTLQYPNFLFPGKTQYSEDKPPENLKIIRLINSVNPFNWIKSGLKIRKEKADLVISRFWLPFMGPSLGTILRIASFRRKTRISSITDNIIPHEKRIGDFIFSKYYVGANDEFLVMSQAVKEDLRKFTKTKKIQFCHHPVYDNYGEILPKEEARRYLKLNPVGRYVLFFGIIRAYKGLDLLLKAMKNETIKELGIQCIIAGEYYEDKQKYEDLIDSLCIREQLVIKTHFIPNDEVKYYFSAADLVVQPYKTATQSGISQLAYYFEKPMVVTKVGGLPEIVDHQKNGYVVHPRENEVAKAIIEFYEKGKEQEFVENVKKRKKDFSWESFVSKILLE